MLEEFKTKTCTTYTADIYVAGPIHQAEIICQEFCLIGLCVSISETTFVYTGGKEFGVRVTLINYPRFPKEPSFIKAQALELAKVLVEKMFQGSASVVCSDETFFISRRPGE